MKEDNPFLRFFPAFRRLRHHSVRLARHHIASAACVPSRATLITGQYPSRHLVTQTAGMFKQDYDPGFPGYPVTRFHHRRLVPRAGLHDTLFWPARLHDAAGPSQAGSPRAGI
jgi:hypothetical protein